MGGVTRSRSGGGSEEEMGADGGQHGPHAKDVKEATTEVVLRLVIDESAWGLTHKGACRPLRAPRAPASSSI